MALGGISEWFDDYIAGEEADPGEEPELHKGMVLLLARCWEYRLKTEDVLELCQGNRRIALCTVSGVEVWGVIWRIGMAFGYGRDDVVFVRSLFPPFTLAQLYVFLLICDVMVDSRWNSGWRLAGGGDPRRR